LQALWEQRIQDLREYKRIHGHCNVAVKGKDGDLGKFVMNQRYYYKTSFDVHGMKNSLTSERIEDLEKLGFVWTLKGKREGDKFLTNKEKWERNIEELIKYKDKFGHVNVAKSGEYVELGQFVGNQRYFYRRYLKGESNSLTEDRINRLSDLGFEWKARNKGAMGSLVHISSKKTTDGTQVVEKDREIALPDGSVIDCATKESSQKRFFIVDGSHLLETTTKTYTTKIEKCVIPSQYIVQMDVNPDIKPALPGTPNVFDLEKKKTYLDGSSVVITTVKSLNKRLLLCEDNADILETITTTITTKVEQSYIPDESKGTIEMQLAVEPIVQEVELSTEHEKNTGKQAIIERKHTNRLDV